MLAHGAPTDRPAAAPARFKAGDRVRAINLNPTTHTRLPRYVRGHVGVVDAVRGCQVFPDTNALGREDPQWLYTVRFAARRSVGARRAATQVSIGGRLGKLSRAGLTMAASETSVRRLTETVPGIPRDADGPVFREPWEAQAFAMTLALHERGLFTWTEWAATLADEIKRAQAAGDPDTGETYYPHWLAALERLVAAKGWRARRR